MPASPRVVYLHIGPPKTATTYLQDVFWRNRAALRDQHVTFPGDGLEDHFLAAQDVRGMQFGGHAEPAIEGAWERLAGSALRSGSAKVLLSHELFAAASTDQIAAALSRLEGAEVHVVYGARDLGRQLPAVWQENVKNRRSQPYEEYLAAVFGRGNRRAKGFWRAQDPVAALARWESAVPAERIHVVTLPQSVAPRSLLWERVCQVLGIEPMGFDLDVARPNPSLSPAESEVLRRINEQLPENLPWPVYDRTIKRWFNERANTEAARDRLTVPHKYRAATTRRAARSISALQQSAYDIVGDLAELMPDDSAFAPIRGQGREAALTSAVQMLTSALVEAPTPDVDAARTPTRLRVAASVVRRRVAALRGAS